MKYQDILPINRYEAEEAFASNNVERICYSMVSIAFYEQDWKWAQDKCLAFFLCNDYRISSLAATCLGHIARVHGKLEKSKVVKILESRMGNPEIAGFIEDALDDINMFVKM